MRRVGYDMRHVGVRYASFSSTQRYQRYAAFSDKLTRHLHVTPAVRNIPNATRRKHCNLACWCVAIVPSHCLIRSNVCV